MPEMDGVETFKRIRAQEGGLNIDTPVVVLTANAIKGSREEYFKIGFNDVCYKPTKQMELNDTLVKWTQNRA